MLPALEIQPIFHLKQFFDSRSYFEKQKQPRSCFNFQFQTIIAEYQRYHRLKIQDGFLNAETYAQMVTANIPSRKYANPSENMRYILSLFLLLSGALICFSQENKMSFTDGTETLLPLKPVDYAPLRFARVESFKSANKTAIGFFEIVGKARPLDFPGRLPRETFRKQARLFDKIDKITTDCLFKQNGAEFYIKCLNSVRCEKLLDCKACEVKAKLIIMEFGINGKIYFVPLIQAVEKVK